MELLANGLVAIKMMVLVIFVADRQRHQILNINLIVIHVLKHVLVTSIMLFNMGENVFATIHTQHLLQHTQERTTTIVIQEVAVLVYVKVDHGVTPSMNKQLLDYVLIYAMDLVVLKNVEVHHITVFQLGLL